MTLAAVVLFVAASVDAQQKPGTAAEKEAAEQKAAMDAMARMAAQQAEAVARAQQKVAEEARRAEEERLRQLEAKRNELIPVDVEVVISRYQNDKRVSSLPYFLAVNAASEDAPVTKLRMGANVPVPASTFTPGVTADGKPANPLVSYSYRDVGTNIDCRARPLGDGRFAVYVSVGERSVVQPPSTCNSSVSCAPVIRNFETENTLVLRDGQTRQFTAAADRVTGEVVKVDVTLKVAK
jgi:hypothetical protein